MKRKGIAKLTAFVLAAGFTFGEGGAVMMVSAAPTEQSEAAVPEYGFAKCDEYVNIRATGDAESELVGTIRNNGYMNILGIDENDWYHITSGNVEGYIASQFVVTGDEAAVLADTVGYTTAESTAVALNMRKEANADSAVVGSVTESEKVEVLAEDGDWVKVLKEDVSGYVSEDYVTLNTEYKLAETPEEMEARLAEEAAAEETVSEDMVFEAEVTPETEESAEETYAEETEAPAEETYAEETEAPAEETYYEETEAPAEETYEETYAESCEDTTYEETYAESYEDTTYEETYEESYEDTTYDESYGETYEETYDESYDNTYEEEYVEETYAEETYAEETEASSSSSDSSLGQSIASYACQFVGNPYVYGGASLTSGADCSGFVMAVFANFGISLPHYSGSQMGYGTAVDASSLQPGDLVFYGPGGSQHVAIYIGGGAIVHAANESTGITTSDMYWSGTPTGYRRLV